MLIIWWTQTQILHKFLGKCYLDCKPATHIKLHSHFLGLVLLLTTNGAATGRHVKFNFMDGTMNFSFQDSPVKRKMREDVSFHGTQAPRFWTWPWKTPSNIRACLSAIWNDCLVCRAGLCPCGLTCCLCEPQPWASFCGCPGPARGNWPTWNTIQVSSGPLAVHTPHLTTGQTSLSIALALQKKVYCFFLDGSKITKKTWTANLEC